MSTSPSLCVLPWINTQIQIDGSTKLCCVAQEENYSPETSNSIFKDSAQTLFNASFLKRTRLQMQAGIWPSACATCKNNEALGVLSYRQQYNNKYPAYFKQLQEAPQTFEPKIRTIDLRISNLCNFKCRMCGPALSSRWSEDMPLFKGKSPEKSGIKGIHEAHAFWEEFYNELIYSVEEIHFAGGEPLLTEEHYKILTRLIEIGKTDVELYYDSNLSKLSLKSWDVIELWKQFSKVNLSMSLDAVGPMGEYIRHGLNYEQWQKNVARIKAETPHVKRNLHFVVNVFNVLDFQFHFDEIIKNQFVEPQFFGFTFMAWPQSLNVQTLHPELKSLVKQRLENMLQHDPLVRQEGVYDHSDFIQGLIGYLYQQDLYAEHIKDFRHETNLLDQHRGERLLDLVPELALMFTEAEITV